jgi:hypothetical protein
MLWFYLSGLNNQLFEFQIKSHGGPSLQKEHLAFVAGKQYK